MREPSSARLPISPPREASRGCVVTLSVAGLDHPPDGHENATRQAIAMHLAGIMGLAFGGEYDPAANYTGRVYFVPNDTVVGCARAAALGIRGPADLFGAVVPHAVHATKAITHPLVRDGVHTPVGWSCAFADAVRRVVLDGATAFTAADAQLAVSRLLREGPARIKRCSGTGGAGQFRVTTVHEAAEVLTGIDESELRSAGVVVEQHLADVVTHSVGQVRVHGLVVTYHGTQALTHNNRGAEVYGGSRLALVRGGFDALLALDLAPDVRLAIEQARTYDDAAHEHFDGMFASRRNYDVAQGVDAHGRRRSGVLEQSWRMGGASGAEIAALQAFHDDPSLQQVRARTVEVFGACEPPPADAVIYFRGVDERIGQLTKYALLEHDEHAG